MCFSLCLPTTWAQMQTWSQKCPADGCAWSLQLWTEDLQRQQQAEVGAGQCLQYTVSPRLPSGSVGGCLVLISIPQNLRRELVDKPPFRPQTDHRGGTHPGRTDDVKSMVKASKAERHRSCGPRNLHLEPHEAGCSLSEDINILHRV